MSASDNSKTMELINSSSNRCVFMTLPPESFLYFLVAWATFVIPGVISLHCLVTSPPTILQSLALLVMTPLLIGVGMSVCLHRYFSHTAFTSSSRLFTSFLAILSTFAYQNGPLWWAGKHCRHHRHCDVDGDPHSPIVSGSILYSWLGWTCDPKEQHYDLAFIPKQFVKLPELWVIDRLAHAISWATWAVAWALWGEANATYWLIGPMILTRLLSLAFNVKYHPRGAIHKDPKLRHQDLKCLSLDRLQGIWGVLASVVGEAHHLDHHVKPRREKRPGLDAPWYITVPLWRAAGLVRPLAKSFNLAADDL